VRKRSAGFFPEDFFTSETIDTRPFIPIPTGRICGLHVSQAFNAWLPSSSPYGTVCTAFDVDAHGRRTLRCTLAPCVLFAVFALTGLSTNGAIPEPTRHPARIEHALDIRVQANAFGKATPDDIAVVIRSAASELFRYCPHTHLDGIDVYYRSNHPEIDSRRTPGGRIAMALSARDTRWAQYSFQFAHEFCHALANYANSSQQTIPDTPNPNLWLEESLCETASLFALRAMSRSWEFSPPSPALRAYAPWLTDYVQQRLTLPEYRLPAETSFLVWFRSRQSTLRQNAVRRDWNTIIATELLPIFESEPAGWESVTFLNRGPADGRQTLSEHLTQWRASCPDHLRPFVTRLAAVFGVNLG
jgi:hypothetical protein